jgi:penicillin-binding protein 2
VPLFNRAINGQYAPGSTFKPLVGLAGLAMGVMDWEEQIVDHGWFRLPGQQRVYRDWSWTRGESGGQGRVDLTRAIYRSSNVYFYDLATRMDVDRLADFAGQFGLGARLALDLPEASAGAGAEPGLEARRPGRALVSGRQREHGIGQGDLLVTPLQLAAMTATIANRGPRGAAPNAARQRPAAAGIRSAAATCRRSRGPSAEDWERMVDAMEDVVHRGNLAVFGPERHGLVLHRPEHPYRMAGKVGDRSGGRDPSGRGL